MRDCFRLACHAKMSASQPNTGEMDLYGEIIEHVDERWKFNSEDKSAKDFRNALQKLKDEGAKNLLLHINSPGGVFTESVAMRGILAGAGFEDVTVRVEGLCASAATIVASTPGAKVEIMEGSFFMIHDPWTFVWGNANDMEAEVEILRKIEASAQGFYAERSGQDSEQIKTWMHEETWFTAEEAVQYGFADEVLKAKAAPVAAMVNTREIGVMREMYRNVPANLAQHAVTPAPEENDGSNDIPVAGVSPVIEQHEEGTRDMEIRDITVEQLRAENPALMQEIQQEAIETERQRIEEIDTLTEPGYEQMAAKAKADGTSAQAFYKAVVAEKRKKGEEFLANRAAETAPAMNVIGAAAEDNKPDEQTEIDALAKELSELAMRTNHNSMF